MFLLVFFLSIPLTGGLELPRGVSLMMASFYNPGLEFSCIDGSAQMSWIKVNDDYCDCRDGSDEPGTSACPNGRFTCRNPGYKAEELPSSRVNDGLCDCCDGSDEYSGLVNCENICGAIADALRESLRSERLKLDEGHRIYQQYVKDKAARIVEERKANKEAKLMTQNQLQESTNNSAGIQTDQTSFESMPQIDLPPPPMAPPSEPSISPYSLDSESHSAELQSQESINLNQTLEEKEIRDHEVSEQDELDPESASSTNSQLEPQELPQTPSPRTMPVDYGPKYAFSMLVEPDVGCLTFDELDYTYRLCPFDRAFQAPRGSTSGGTLLGQWAGWLGKGHPKPGTIADVDEARGETIDKQKHDASDDSSTSDSTDEAGEFEKKIDQSSERKLERTWKTDQEEDENEEEVEEKKRDRVYDIMLYENGVQCWNGPARSVKAPPFSKFRIKSLRLTQAPTRLVIMMRCRHLYDMDRARVYVHCGSKNEITSISESSRCLYDFHLSTPAACHLPAEKALAAKYPEMVWDDLPVHTEL